MLQRGIFNLLNSIIQQQTKLSFSTKNCQLKWIIRDKKLIKNILGEFLDNLFNNIILKLQVTGNVRDSLATV